MEKIRNSALLWGDGTGRVLLAGPLLTEEELAATARDEDRRAAAAFASARRRREYLSWRVLLYGYLGDGARVEYGANGAPRLVSHPDICLSVSHCRDMVAVALSERRCGVDVERLDRDFSKAAPRFLSEGERALSGDGRLAAAVWCAKECLYKMYGHEGMDFLRDIRIVGVDFEGATICGSVDGGASVTMRMVFTAQGHIVVFAL